MALKVKLVKSFSGSSKDMLDTIRGLGLKNLRSAEQVSRLRGKDIEPNKLAGEAR